MLHLYLSETRVRDVVFQYDNESLSEKTQKTDKVVTIKSGIKGGLPVWLNVIGFKGEGNVGADGSITISNSKLQKPTDFNIVSILKLYLDDDRCVFLNETADFLNVKVNKIIRVKSKFRPLINGSDGIERIINFKNSDLIEWQTILNGVTIKFGTTPSSFLTNTPIYQCLHRDDNSLNIDFFGTLDYLSKDKQELSLTPLFFGVEFD